MHSAAELRLPLFCPPFLCAPVSAQLLSGRPAVPALACPAAVRVLRQRSSAARALAVLGPFNCLWPGGRRVRYKRPSTCSSMGAARAAPSAPVPLNLITNASCALVPGQLHLQLQGPSASQRNPGFVFLLTPGRAERLRRTREWPDGELQGMTRAFHWSRTWCHLPGGLCLGTSDL